jgi:hypothetical protein
MRLQAGLVLAALDRKAGNHEAAESLFGVGFAPLGPITATKTVSAGSQFREVNSAQPSPNWTMQPGNPKSIDQNPSLQASQSGLNSTSRYSACKHNVIRLQDIRQSNQGSQLRYFWSLILRIEALVNSSFMRRFAVSSTNRNPLRMGFWKSVTEGTQSDSA